MKLMIKDKVKDQLVDERFELVTLIFYLAGNYGYYNESQARYFRKLDAQFSSFKKHPAIIYAKRAPALKYIDPEPLAFNLASYLKKVDDKFMLINDFEFSFDCEVAKHCVMENAVEFIKLLNDFYAESKFAIFFSKHTKYYQKHSSLFTKQVLNEIIFDWFSYYGMASERMRVILSPFNQKGYISWTPEINYILYTGVAFSKSYHAYHDYENAIVHQFSCIFAANFSNDWYTDNEMFRKWCDETVTSNGKAAMPDGRSMAYAYVTRVYAIVYFVEARKENLSQMLHKEKEFGYIYMKQVYDWITNMTDREGFK